MQECQLQAATASGRAAQLSANLDRTQRELDSVRALHAAATELVAEYEGGTSRRCALPLLRLLCGFEPAGLLLLNLM